jgi:DHA3 family macrolide efflux protein-like MFS transporter
MTAASTRAANWQAHFISFFTGQAISLFGTQLVQFALIWWLTSSTHSATVLATATLASLLPGVILAPAAGVWVDQWNRRWVMILSDSLAALASVVLIVLFAVGQAQVWQVFILMFIRATGNAFQLPAMMSSTSLMVPEDHLMRVSGYNQSLAGAMNIVAPPVGALLLQTVPMQAILSIDVVTALVGVAPLFFIHVPQPAPRHADAASARAAFWPDLRAGLRYVLAWPGLMVLLGMALVLNFMFNPTAALLPILVAKHFGGGALQLATLDSADGVGIVVGGLALGVWGGFHRRIFTTLIGVVGLSLAFGSLGLLPPSLFWVAVGAMFVGSVMQVMTNGPILAIMQATVAPDMQGRVFSLITALATGISPIGLIVAGPMADAFGPRSWFVVAGVVGILMGVAGFFIPALVHMEDQAAQTLAAVTARPPAQAPVVPGDTQ